MRKLSINEWCERANTVHNFRYDYSKVVYLGGKSKVVIICKLHGEFEQQATNHLSGKGCPKCNGGILLSKDEWIKKSCETHHNFYDYSKVDFHGVKYKVLIICPLHGEFWQIAEKHFLYGCQVCGENKPITVESFIQRAKQIHGNKYNYSLIVSINGKDSKVKIVCDKHGPFEQIVNNHLRGRGCKYCAVGNSSIKEQKWLDIMGLPCDPLHRNVKILVGSKHYIVDGYFPHINTIFEFLGDYWHGNPRVYHASDMNTSCKKTFGELFSETELKLSTLKNSGFRVISIWELDFDKELK